MYVLKACTAATHMHCVLKDKVYNECLSINNESLFLSFQKLQKQQRHSEYTIEGEV